MKGKLLILVPLLLAIAVQSVNGQRSYAEHSVLSAGSWYRIGISRAGVYRLDASFLRQLGLNSGFPSSAIRVYGNGAGMLPEDNKTERIDDLREIAIQVQDGGDGSFDPGDLVLLYAEGPEGWHPDSAGRDWQHFRDLYTDTLYYYISLGGAGKRISVSSTSSLQSSVVSQYDLRVFHEKDSFNFLASGKEWYGEEFSDAPGKSLVNQFSPGNLLLTGSTVRLRYSFAARAVGNNSSVAVRFNGQSSTPLSIPAVSGALYDRFAQERTATAELTAGGEPLSFELLFQPGSFNAQGWLNWYELFGRAPLQFSGQNLFFRDRTSLHTGATSFVIAGASPAMQVWDISDAANPVERQLLNSGFQTYFNCDTDSLHEFVAFDPATCPIPLPLGAVPNQDLHGSSPAQYIVICPPGWRNFAEQLAAQHEQSDTLSWLVADTRQVFNEFASGRPDPVAIRDFVKMLYDRSAGNASQRPLYLVLMGTGSYDYRGIRFPGSSVLPAFESASSLDPLATYTSDDFFALLDDNENFESLSASQLLDIRVGRIPARTETELSNFLNKLNDYQSAASLGPWRRSMQLLADDEDNNLHLQDAESLSNTITAAAAGLLQDKIYLDAYPQQTSAGGSRYPEVNQQINNGIFSGQLIWNYSGHGGPTRLAEEDILDFQSLAEWKNRYRLPLFITATCDFAPFDNPGISSLGSEILLRASTGGVALLSTTRVVYAFSNRIINENYLRYALNPDSTGRFPTLGAALFDAKNFTIRTSADIINNRKFNLLGDPALRLAFPKEQVMVDELNGQPVGATADTLAATQKVTISGHLADAAGQLLSDFNGTLYPVLFDRAQSRSTLGNDPGSQPVSFSTQQNVLFRGKATVKEGRFSFEFRLPKDVSPIPAAGKLSLYAENGQTDAGSDFSQFVVGGVGSGVSDDNEGPEISAWLNDEKFVNGGLANEQPLLLLKLKDSSGINTAGTGIDHDLVATLDQNNQDYFVLNEFYEAELDNYQAGTVRFQLPKLDPGPHTLHIKAWDVLNNSSEKELGFVVASDEKLQISHVLNYPNPFSSSTAFWFEHNKPGQDLLVQIQIFTISGKLIKIFHQTINTSGNRSCEVIWDGRDRFGDKLGRGVYLYRLKVSSSDQQTREVIQKLVIF